LICGRRIDPNDPRSRSPFTAKSKLDTQRMRQELQQSQNLTEVRTKPERMRLILQNELDFDLT
jgi:hypothetical protein